MSSWLWASPSRGSKLFAWRTSSWRSFGLLGNKCSANSSWASSASHLVPHKAFLSHFGCSPWCTSSTRLNYYSQGYHTSYCLKWNSVPASVWRKRCCRLFAAARATDTSALRPAAWSFRWCQLGRLRGSCVSCLHECTRTFHLPLPSSFVIISWPSCASASERSTCMFSDWPSICTVCTVVPSLWVWSYKEKNVENLLRVDASDSNTYRRHSLHLCRCPVRQRDYWRVVR